MIAIDNVDFSYGSKSVLHEFSLTLGEGQRICLFGESGCGKTTVLRLLLGLETPQGGSITGLSGIKISAVFQENRLLPFATVLQNLLLVSDEATARKHLAALGLSDVCGSYPTDLSGGMARRAAIARALSADYDFLILDEPFTGLDRENVRTAAEYISRCCGGRPMLLVTHSAEEAALLGAEIKQMNPV